MYRLLLYFLEKIKSIRSYLQKKQFNSCGKNVYVGHDCEFIPSHIHIGNHVLIGDRASFIASISHIYIGNYVMIGPNVTIRGGDHRYDLIGKYMYDVKENEKLPKNDANVKIDDDVWIGCNVTILKGVHIGRGAIVGAGSVLRNSVPPYAIVLGNPAKVIKFRFNEKQILEHEKQLYEKKSN
jgi:maltose O-acetyltransferase